MFSDAPDQIVGCTWLSAWLSIFPREIWQLCQLCCGNCALGVVNEHRSGLRAMMFEYVGCAVASASIVSAVLLHTFFVCGDITELDNEA